MKAFIEAIEYFLPKAELSNEQLSEQFPEWSKSDIEKKLGIKCRHIADRDQYSSDLAVEAANVLFAKAGCDRRDVDFLILCTQSPDYFLPTTACLIQSRLNLREDVGAFDFNLGCSGFVYGLGIAKGLIETQQARKVLLLTAETYSKFMHPNEKGVKTLFGDGSAATLIGGVGEPCEGEPLIGPFVYGTDGRGGKNLIVRNGGLRHGRVMSDDPESHLFMNGPEILSFTLKAVPLALQKLLDRSSSTIDTIDYFIFHQANKYMLEALRKKCKIPEQKFVIEMEDSGNTVSSTIPIALKKMLEKDYLKDGQKLVLVGFGVGYSWAAVHVIWSAKENKCK